MIRKMTGRMHRTQRGITGLETAIILIAFVVVASVFAYTVLSAGLFSTQKSQEAINSGMEEAQSTLELKGGVLALRGTDTADGDINQIKITVSNVLKGEPIDFTAPTAETDGIATSTNHSTIISYTDAYQKVDNLYWTVTKLAGADSDDLLEDGEKFEITIGGSTAGGVGTGNGLEAALSNQVLEKNTRFSIEITPSRGAVLAIERTTPAAIDAVNYLG